MSGTMTVNAYVDISGALADGTADSVIADYCRQVAQRIAEQARDMLRQIPMDKTGRAVGGFADSLEVVERDLGYAVPGPMIRGVTWAPWLEGITPRNKTTHFAGYHPFARVRAQLADGLAQEIAEDYLQRYLPRIGGDT